MADRTENPETWQQVEAVWKRIEAWFTKNIPQYARGLRPPASLEWVARTEEALNISFPDDFLASLAVHDGSEHEVFENWELLSLPRILETWRMDHEMMEEGPLKSVDDPLSHRTEGGVRPREWDPKWIPLATDGGGEELVIDLNPAETGQLGQVVWTSHKHSHRRVVANSYFEWLQDFAGRLESGALVVDRYDISIVSCDHEDAPGSDSPAY